MFRDSRGVVHTVSSPDPLDDLPASAAAVLAGALLVPVDDDLGGTLERCEAVAALLDSWQDAFFAALPAEVDRDTEARYAAEAGIDLDDLEPIWDDDDDSWVDPWDPDASDPGGGGTDGVDIEVEGQLGFGAPGLDLDEDLALLGHAADPVTAALDEEFVARLERDLLLLPLRVRLEALLAASSLVEGWAELLADQEKLLGHLVLAHHHAPLPASHEALADQHAAAHEGRAGHL